MVKKGIKLLTVTFLIYGILVATHLGEFWPFSIYPMFSKAGNPWTRSLVSDVTNKEDSPNWETKINDVPDSVFALNEININQNDLSNFISKNEDWSERKISNVRKYFKDKLDDRQMLIYKVQGRLADANSDSTVIIYTPFIFLEKDTTIFNSDLVDIAKVTEN